MLPTTNSAKKHCLYSGEFGCSEEILSIAAMLQIKNVFVTPSNEKKPAVCFVLFSSLNVEILVSMSDPTTFYNFFLICIHRPEQNLNFPFTKEII